MIAHLSGTLLSKQATSAIVDVAGVGYEVAIPVSTFYELGEVGSPAQLRIYTHVREEMAALSSPALEEEFAAQAAGAVPATTEDAIRNDAMSALANLGYQKSAAEKAVKTAVDEGGELSVELILRRSLRSLAKT